MTGMDFDEIGDLWRGNHDPEEERIFQSLARKVSRRALAISYMELAFSLLLIVAITVACLWSPGAASKLISGIIILVILWASWRRHLLAQTAMIVDTSDRCAFIESAQKSVSASLLRSTLGMWLFLPGVASGALLKYTVLRGESLRTFGQAVFESITNLDWVATAGTLTIITLVILVRINLRLRRELKLLERLKNEYAAEERYEAEAAE